MKDNYSESEVDFVLKIVLIGESGVGKTNILSRYINNHFNESIRSTIGVEFATTFVKIDDILLRLQIWDTAGQERFRAITSSFYKGCSGAFVVYDITKRETFDMVDHWIKELKSKAGESIAVVLIGNKLDLESAREVKEHEGLNKAQLLGMYILTFKGTEFIETSAKTTKNVDEAFANLTNSKLLNL